MHLFIILFTIYVIGFIFLSYCLNSHLKTIPPIKDPRVKRKVIIIILFWPISLLRLIPKWFYDWLFNIKR